MGLLEKKEMLNIDIFSEAKERAYSNKVKISC
jgi:hypothetical protein